MRKNEGTPMKNQGKVKEKVRKPYPGPKKIKFPKQEKTNPQKKSAPQSNWESEGFSMNIIESICTNILEVEL